MASENNDTQNASKPSTEQVYTITKEMLPLHCPTPEMSLWNSHPRVYLPIEETGKVSCPYCGTQFTLQD